MVGFCCWLPERRSKAGVIGFKDVRGFRGQLCVGNWQAVPCVPQAVVKGSEQYKSAPWR